MGRDQIDDVGQEQINGDGYTSVGQQCWVIKRQREVKDPFQKKGSEQINLRSNMHIFLA